MDEPRDQPPEADTPQPATATATRLTPLQEAWVAYKAHTASCPRCRTEHGGRCEEASRLWRAHRDLCDDAYRQLGGETV